MRVSILIDNIKNLFADFNAIVTNTLGMTYIQDCTFYWYCDDSIKRGNVYYYGSGLLGHGTHQDSLNYFTSLNEDLNKGHSYQVSMDGPNVNLNFFEEFSIQKDNFYSFIDIGSFVLHIVVHGSFSRGELKSSWNLKKLLKGAYHFLHHSLARIEDYNSVCSSSTYPLSFCSTR